MRGSKPKSSRILDFSERYRLTDGTQNSAKQRNRLTLHISGMTEMGPVADWQLISLQKRLRTSKSERPKYGNDHSWTLTKDLLMHRAIHPIRWPCKSFRSRIIVASCGPARADFRQVHAGRRSVPPTVCARHAVAAHRPRHTIVTSTFGPIDRYAGRLRRDPHRGPSLRTVDFHGELTRVFHRELTRLSVMLRGSGWGQGMCDLLLFPGRCG